MYRMAVLISCLLVYNNFGASKAIIYSLGQVLEDGAFILKPIFVVFFDIHLVSLSHTYLHLEQGYILYMLYSLLSLNFFIDVVRMDCFNQLWV
jgi:hypothetical protein